MEAAVASPRTAPLVVGAIQKQPNTDPMGRRNSTMRQHDATLPCVRTPTPDVCVLTQRNVRHLFAVSTRSLSGVRSLRSNTFAGTDRFLSHHKGRIQGTRGWGTLAPGESSLSPQNCVTGIYTVFNLLMVRGEKQKRIHPLHPHHFIHAQRAHPDSLCFIGHICTGPTLVSLFLAQGPRGPLGPHSQSLYTCICSTLLETSGAVQVRGHKMLRIPREHSGWTSGTLGPPPQPQ